MYDHNISGMVDALKEAGVLTRRSADTAHHTLRKFWTDQIALVWTAQDVSDTAEQIGVAKTPESCSIILRRIMDRHDADIGVSWDTVRSVIIESRDLP